MSNGSCLTCWDIGYRSINMNFWIRLKGCYYSVNRIFEEWKMVEQLTLDDFTRRIMEPAIKSFTLNYIQSGLCDTAISEKSIEYIYDIYDNDIKNAVLDRLKVIDGMDLPRVKA